jgi:hypothetical protein
VPIKYKESVLSACTALGVLVEVIQLVKRDLVVGLALLRDSDLDAFLDSIVGLAVANPLAFEYNKRRKKVVIRRDILDDRDLFAITSLRGEGLTLAPLWDRNNNIDPLPNPFYTPLFIYIIGIVLSDII